MIVIHKYSSNGSTYHPFKDGSFLFSYFIIILEDDEFLTSFLLIEYWVSDRIILCGSVFFFINILFSLHALIGTDSWGGINLSAESF